MILKARLDHVCGNAPLPVLYSTVLKKKVHTLKFKSFFQNLLSCLGDYGTFPALNISLYLFT